MPTPEPQKPLAKYAWSTIARAAPPKRTADDRLCDFGEIYGEYDEATVRAQASRCIQCPNALCMQGCPLSNRIPEWLALAAQGLFLEAAEISRATSNMPEICSRVCPQEKLCEGACILNGKAEPVAIGSVERFINDYAFRHGGVQAVPVKPNGFRVAVIGSGPGGMSCADELIQLGYGVTIFESLLIPGGLLVNGIPGFKLEKDIVERRIDLLVKRGVKIELGVKVGWDVSLAQLRRDYDAVFVGVGAQKPKTLDIPGGERSGVIDALPFLVEKNVDSPLVDLPKVDVKGKRVAVLGGGDTAMDCLRTALRCGASEVACLYRRDLANMPGSRKDYYTRWKREPALSSSPTRSSSPRGRPVAWPPSSACGWRWVSRTLPAAASPARCPVPNSSSPPISCSWPMALTPCLSRRAATFRPSPSRTGARSGSTATR